MTATRLAADEQKNWLLAFLTPGRQIFLFNWVMLSLVLYNGVLGLGSVVRAYPIPFASLTLAGGIFIGFGLSGKNWFVRLLALLAALAGLALAFIYFADLTGPLVSWARAGIYALLEIWRERQSEIPPDLSAYYLAGLELNTTVGVVFVRLQAWAQTLAAGAPAYDGLASSLIWGGSAWLLAVWAGWALPRLGSPFYSAAPTGILMAVCLNYAGGDARYLLPFLGILGAWMAIYFAIQSQKRWQIERIDYAEDVRVDIGLSASLLMGLLVMFALLTISIPEIRLEDLARWLDQIRATPAGPPADVALSFGIERPTQQPTPTQPPLPAVLPQQHLLGSGPELSQRLVMTIQIINQGERSPNQRYYWRSQTFDEYTGSGWRTSTLEIVEKASGITLSQTKYPGQRLIEQEVRQINRSRILYTAGSLYSADHNFTTTWRITQGENPALPALDFIGALINTNQYRALSYINAPSETSLQNPSGEIPAWIIQQYTPLPAGTPARVLDLAWRLTRQAGSSYERAQAIETYLRTLEYTLDLPAPPANRDVVDYYLFDLQRGYCDYSASAMVVLARAAGLPARLVTGYASGTYDTANDRYVVTEADAHSWPEVYIAGIGWVEFEPTGGRPERQVWAAEMPTLSPEMEAQILEAYDLPTGQIALTVGVSLAALGLLWLGIMRYRLNRLTPNGLVREIYRRYHRPARQIAADQLAGGYTPLELSSAVQTQSQQTIRRLSGQPALTQLARWAALGVTARLEKLTDLYNRAVYAADPLDGEQARAMEKLWGQLRNRLYLLARLVKFAGKLGEKKDHTPSETESHDNP